MATKPAHKAEDAPVGHRLRARRRELGLTLKDVAAQAGLSFSFIAQVERGIAVPSLSSLVSICKVLRTDVGTYLHQPGAGNARFTRHGQRPLYSPPGAPADGQSQPIRYERVSTNFPGRRMHSVIMNMPPGYRSETIAHDGEELLFVLSGELTTIVDGHHVILQAGDSEHFPSTCPHSTWNHTNAMATALWVGTQQLFSESGGEDDPTVQDP